MDGYSRLVTVHMLKNKSSEVVNNHLKEYVLWAERQAGRMIKKVITHKVMQVLTDKGGEFVSEPWRRSTTRAASSTSRWDPRARS
ncbi:hypothetical protein PF003_g11080 [Phytophthora fragariae]|nr:hypothetical protein PF003_g11080 [Phytophthora fragariae]